MKYIALNVVFIAIAIGVEVLPLPWWKWAIIGVIWLAALAVVTAEDDEDEKSE